MLEELGENGIGEDPEDIQSEPTPVAKQVGSHGHRFKNFGFNIEDSDIIKEESNDESDSNTSTPRK